MSDDRAERYGWNSSDIEVEEGTGKVLANLDELFPDEDEED